MATVPRLQNSNSSGTTPPKTTFGKRVAQTVTYPLHSNEILQRLQDHKLSPIHSIFIKLTETPLKAIGSAFTAILAPFAGLKLFNGSDSSSDSIFKSWGFLALLGLGAGTSFAANSYLSSSTESPKSLDNKADDTTAKPAGNAGNTAEESPEITSRACEILQDLLSEPTLFTLLKPLQIKEKLSKFETLNLSNYGLVSSYEVSEGRYVEGTWANSSPYYRTFMDKNTMETKILTLRIKADALVSAFDTQNDQPIEVQVITRNQNTPDVIESIKEITISRNSFTTKARGYAAAI